MFTLFYFDGFYYYIKEYFKYTIISILRDVLLLINKIIITDTIYFYLFT
jgi:hypothetical protein